MSWIAGVRGSTLYTIQKRPLDPRWSNTHLQTMLGFCATGMHLGLTEHRAFQAAEAITMKMLLPGISWPYESLLKDIHTIMNPEGITLVQEEQ